MGCTRHIQKNLFLIAVVLPWHVLKIQLNFDDMKSLHLSLSGALKKGWELTKKHFIVMLGLVLGYIVGRQLARRSRYDYVSLLDFVFSESGFVCVGQCGIR